MVIGNGLIATKFSPYSNNKEIIIFASGVSNSKDATESDFSREFNLLKSVIEKYKDKLLIYFSTCSIYDADENNSAYVLHKLNIENYIKLNVSNFYIFRVSNLVGKNGNSKTVLNYFFSQLKNGSHFYLWKNARRNLIDIDDMKNIIDYILENSYKKNSIINIANPQSNNVPEIIEILEKTTNLKAAFTTINKGSNFIIDVTDIMPIISHLKIKFNDNYLADLIKKYFRPQ
jgi:nucleoside-diphosphate-sugar epimerase